MPFHDDDNPPSAPSNRAEDHRVALVIGNGAYSHASVLNNPANDADKMSDMLTNLGFEVVGGAKNGINIGRDPMEDLLCEFEEKAENAESSLLFYAGHGLQVGNKNYLLPVDADIKLETHLRRRAFSLNEILNIMGRKRRTSIVFLDACRDNPFARQLGRSMGTRDAAVRGGLADTGRIPGSLIAFATEPDNVAYDGKNENSPFTSALLRHIEKPGQSVMDMMVHVRNDVVRETAAKQQPWTQYSLEKIFYFIPEIKGQESIGQTPTHIIGEAERRWEQVKDSQDIGLLKVFQTQFKGTMEAYYASQRCKLLEQQAAEKTREQDQKREEALQAKKLAEETALKEAGAVRFLVGLKQNSEQKFLKPGDIFQDFEGSPEMVMIPPGTFMMGSPDDEPERNSDETLHEVTLSEPFAMGRYPVTFAQWDMYVTENKGGIFGAKAYSPEDQGWGRGNRPVINVSWDDAQNYIKWLNKRTGHVYGLPTEAQWEYAARAGSSTPFWFGNTITTDQANYDGNYPYNNGDKGEYRSKTLPVDSFDANPFGLYQVHGNVWEWVSDWYGDYEKGSQTNPKGASSGQLLVMRGGGWHDYARVLRSALRNCFPPDGRVNSIGFRLMRQPS